MERILIAFLSYIIISCFIISGNNPIDKPKNGKISKFNTMSLIQDSIIVKSDVFKKKVTKKVYNFLASKKDDLKELIF